MEPVTMLMKLFAALLLHAAAANPLIDFGQQEQISETQNFIPRVIIQTDVIERDQQPFSFDEIKSEAGLKILRNEAVIIAEIQKDMQQGREAERNLTAARDVIRQKMEDTPGFLGGIRRRRLGSRLRELDQRIIELQSSNRDAEARFRTFMTDVASGKIRDPDQAHSILDRIYRTLESTLMKLVQVCYKLLSGIIDTIHSLALGLGNAIHNILGANLG